MHQNLDVPILRHLFYGKISFAVLVPERRRDVLSEAANRSWIRTPHLIPSYLYRREVFPVAKLNRYSE